VSCDVENFIINLLGPQKVGKFVDQLSDLSSPGGLPMQLLNHESPVSLLSG